MLEVEVQSTGASAIEVDLQELRFYVKDEVGRSLAALLMTLPNCSFAYYLHRLHHSGGLT